MDPNPPRPEFQLFIMLLIAVEVAAAIIGNDVILVVVLLIILAVGYQWYRYSKKRSLRAKYNPESGEPKEDWRGKTDKDNEPL